MPTLPRFDKILESGKLVKELPVNSRFFFAANRSAFCRVWASANAAFLELRRGALMGAAVTAGANSPTAEVEVSTDMITFSV